MSTRAVFFVNEAGYEAAWQSTSLGITAVAMGDEVIFVFSFKALCALAEGTFGQPLNEGERVEASRGEDFGAPAPLKMLEDARALGARAVACETTVKLCGLSGSELERKGILDETLGLPQIWRLTQEARVLTF